MTGSPTEISPLSLGPSTFRYFKPRVRDLDFELSLSLQKRPQDLKYRWGPRIGINPDFELPHAAMNRKSRVEAGEHFARLRRWMRNHRSYNRGNAVLEFATMVNIVLFCRFILPRENSNATFSTWRLAGPVGG